jgi:hypothetical protein
VVSDFCSKSCASTQEPDDDTEFLSEQDQPAKKKAKSAKGSRKKPADGKDTTGSKPPAKRKRVQKTKNSSGGEMDSNIMEVVSSSGEEYTRVRVLRLRSLFRCNFDHDQNRHIGSGLHDWLVKGAAFYRTRHYHFSVDVMYQGMKRM